MAHAENSIIIERSVDDVFNFVIDGMNNPLWRPNVTDIEHLPGRENAYKQGLKGPAGRIDGDYEIAESISNELIKFQVIAGPARPTGIYQFESLGLSATRLTFSLDFEPKGLARLMDGMITASMHSEVATLANLKAYLEGSGK